MSCARGGGRGVGPRCRPLVGRRKCGQRRRSVPARDARHGQGKVVRYPQRSRSSTFFVLVCRAPRPEKNGCRRPAAVVRPAVGADGAEPTVAAPGALVAEPRRSARRRRPMVRGVLGLLTAAAGVACACLASPAAATEPAVSLLLNKASAERLGKGIFFRCEVTLDNDTGRGLAVRSNFTSAFDGLEIVVTTPGGKVLAQQGYTFHQSPFAPPGRVFPVQRGKTDGALGFPVDGLPGDVRAFKVRLVGTLPGSGYERILSSETLAVEIKDRPGK